MIETTDTVFQKPAAEEEYKSRPNTFLSSWLAWQPENYEWFEGSHCYTEESNQTTTSFTFVVGEISFNLTYVN